MLKDATNTNAKPNAVSVRHVDISSFICFSALNFILISNGYAGGTTALTSQVFPETRLE